jgi:hypothetical protein
MPLTDTLFTPLMLAARDCLTTGLVGHPDPPQLPACVRWGDHTLMAVARTIDECCLGLPWARFGGAVPTDEAAFPGKSSEVDKCANPVDQWAVTVELGISRCAVVGDATTLPTPADWATLKTRQMEDMAALRRALCCLKPLYRDVSVGSFAPHGPTGRCYHTTLDITVKVLGCGEC